uniref:RNA-directed RNA polymerase n=1 Tax=John dory reovirus FL12 TaxID=2813190 RepID=A0A894JL63_9REOV|nr:MAG: RNA-dependent RNA polymerase [John dory reovirus FL12]
MNPTLRRLSNALSGYEELHNDLWFDASSVIRNSKRDEIYDILLSIDFQHDFLIPPSLLSPKPHKPFWRIDEKFGVVRDTLGGPEDMVYLPNVNLTDLLEVDTDSLHLYGRLRGELKTASKQLRDYGRIAETCYNSAVYQANQLKFPLERFLLILLVCYHRPLSVSPLLVDGSELTNVDVTTNHALSALKSLLLHFRENGRVKPPFLKTSSGVVFALYSDKRPLSAQVAPLMIDLVNYAILIHVCDIDPYIADITVRLMMKAAATDSYNHTQLRLKKLIPAASLLSIYSTNVSGYVPNIVWEEPREDYRFRIDGVRLIPDDWRNDTSGAADAIDGAEKLAREFGMSQEFSDIQHYFSQLNVHCHQSMKKLRDALAGVSSVFITRTPTDTVRQEYVHAPLIERPVRPDDWTAPVGSVRYLKPSTSHEVARHLYDTWKRASSAVANDPDTWDPNNQAILRSQYVTPRGGSGNSVKRSLENAGITLPNFSKSGAKTSTKIMQAAQLAKIPFVTYQDAVMAPVSHGVRIQVQRRSRTIMPLSIPQQQVSAPHTLCGNYINKVMNLSTTSGSNVTEKVIPLGMFGSSPPTKSINIDIKACDSSITAGFFLSIICGAMHDGADNVHMDRPFLGVPATSVNDHLDDGIIGMRPISGYQNMIQHLSRLYDAGFVYEVKDAFAAGNAFLHHTTTFPSGSTATSTEHTANNSTIMDVFLRHWIPRHSCDSDFLAFAHSLDIRRNYVCQGDDGILILPSSTGKSVSDQLIVTFIELLSSFGREVGWVYDIEYNGTSEYLKLLFICGCRIPNVGRHPIVGKERASREKDVVWPGGIDIFLGLYKNGLDDFFHWRRWLRYCWGLACYLSSKAAFLSNRKRTDVIHYNPWSFIYLGLPPISVLSSPPWLCSNYMPAGDLGIYAIMINYQSYFIDCMKLGGYQLPDSDTSRQDTIFGGYDYIRFFNDIGLLIGYYMAKLPRTPDKSTRKTANADADAMINNLSEYLFADPELRARVMRGGHLVNNYHGRIPKLLPSLRQVPRKWFESAVEADIATLDEVQTMDLHLLRAQRHRYAGFSKVLTAYLSIAWEFSDAKVASMVSLETPIVAGCGPHNGDHFYKMHGLGPMMEAPKTYFKGTVFMSKAVSGLDVESVDMTLLQMKALKVPEGVIAGFLMTCGLPRQKAEAIATKVIFQDMKTVQVAKITGLNVSDKWVTLNFDRLLHAYVDVRNYVSESGALIKLPANAGWLRGVMRFLGAAVIMTKAGPPQAVQVSQIHGGGERLYLKFLQWMVRG